MAEKDSKKPNKTEGGSSPQSEPLAEAAAGSDNVSQASDPIQNDPFHVLSAVYEDTERLFEEYGKAERFTRKAEIVEHICNSFIVHASLEEEILYPACRKLVDSQKLEEAQVENDSAKTS